MERVLKQLLLGLLLLVVAPSLTFAQEGAIQGTVTDSETGDPLPGANVLLEEPRLGAATDVNGNYVIDNVPPGEYTLQVTFVGYRAAEQTVDVNAGATTTADVALQPDFTGLEEVVVTGLATEARRADAPVAVSRVDAEQLSEISDYSTVEQLISGNVTGVNVQRSSGNIGSGIRFRVRGGVSLNSDGQPVIYVDGVRIDQGEIIGFGAGGQGTSALADLNPEDIESIEILKGSASTAQYGTDGADGVVLITTKRGLSGQDLRVNYRGTLGATQKVRDYDPDTYISADAANDLFRTGSLMSHNVSARGSFDNINYFSSVTHRTEEGILPNNSGERTNLRANFDVRPNDAVTVEANSSFTLNRMQRPDNDNNIFGQLGNTLLAPQGNTYVFTDSSSVFMIDDQQRVSRFVGSLLANYAPTAVPGLQFQARGGLDVSTRRQDRTFPFEGTYTGVTDGERNVYTRENRQINFDGSARYSYAITDDLAATSIVGGQFFTSIVRTSFATAQEFSTGLITEIGAGSELISIGEGFTDTRSAGVMAQQEFSFRDTYFLEASIRNDFATQLGEEVNNASIIYPSVRASVRLDQFDFIPSSFGLLKWRAAFGQSGALPDLADSERLRLQAEASGFGAGATVSSVGDPALKPERVSELSTGFDIDFLDRYTLEATYFREWTRDSIVPFPPAPSTGFGGFEIPRNVGEVQGQGVELGLGITAIRTQRHAVDLDLNYTYQVAEVQDLDGGVIPGGFDLNFVVEGQEPFVFWQPDVLGAEFDDATGQVVGVRTTDERVKLGAPRPDHFGGARLNVRLFDDLTLSGMAEFAAGHQVFNNTRLFGVLFSNNEEYNRLLDQLFGSFGGELANPLEPGTAEYREAADRWAHLHPDHDANFVEDADWIKIREVSIRYDFTRLLQRAGVTNLRSLSLGLSGNNLATFTEYGGPDPEINFDGSRGQIQGQDFLTLQTPRSVTARLTIGF